MLVVETFSSLTIAGVSSGSAFLALLLLWFIDVVDREPIRNLFITTGIGILGYIISLQVFAWIAEVAMPETISLGPAILNMGASLFLYMLAQVIALRIAIRINRKSIDTLTDHLLYATAVGIGFAIADSVFTQLLMLPAFQSFASVSYTSIYGFGKTLPYLVVGLGLAEFLSSRRAIKPIKNFKSCLVISFLIYLIGQILYASSTFFPNLALPHEYSLWMPLSGASATLATNLSVMLIVSAIGISALWDYYIVNSFIHAALKRKYEGGQPQSGSGLNLYLINPLAFVCCSHAWLWKFMDCESVVGISRGSCRAIAKLGILAWKEPSKYELYLTECLVYI